MAKDGKKSFKEKNNSSKRPPIIAVLGHIDHGKTSLLDYIRKTKLASKEIGGITQKIAAYQIKNPFKITFIDTPGHEAFSKMRSRGIDVADIALLVIAADDSVMPQTKESVETIKEANIPMIVAINKIDLPQANIDKVKKDLLKIGVACEGYGGETVAVNISAKTGEGINELLEIIDLVAEMQKLTADNAAEFKGVVIESNIDKRCGPLATIIVKDGTLRIKDEVVVDNISGKVKGLFNEFGQRVLEVFPSEPVIVLGLNKVVTVGSLMMTRKNKTALQKPSGIKRPVDSVERECSEDKKTINILLKAEAAGTLESIVESLPAEVNIICSGIGEITVSDIEFALATKAIVIGFNVKMSPEAKKLTEIEKVIVRVYSIIYELIEEIDEVIETLNKEPKEIVTGRAKILAKFKINKLPVAGVRIEEGKISIGDKVKVEHNNDTSYGKILSIKDHKIEVKEGSQGKEYGIGLSDKLDFSIGDVILSYNII